MKSIDELLELLTPLMPPTTCIGFSQINDKCTLFFHFTNGERPNTEIMTGTHSEAHMYLDAMYKGASFREIRQNHIERIREGIR